MSAVSLFELVLVLLTASLVLSLLAGKLSWPPAAALVVGGMVLAVIPGTPGIAIDPDLIMVLFLPPLLLASAYFTVWRDFRANLRPILLMSIGAVAFTTAGVGIVTHILAPMVPWAACFALGAIVSPPDAVAAKAVLQRLSMPRRMLTILEGESLVNDASGLVLYRFAVAAALTGLFNPLQAGIEFVWLAVGGIGAGFVAANISGFFFRRLPDTRFIIVLSFLAAYGSYIGAERIGASGVLAVVTSGLIMGWRQHEVLAAQSRTEARAVWSVVVFVMEALVFVLIGLSLRGVLAREGGFAEIVSEMPLALAVTATAILLRFLWVFPATYLPRLLSPALRKRDPSPPLSAPLVIGWAGMRGVVTLAAALALPTNFPGRDTVLFCSFVVILVTVLVQGGSLGPLIRLMKFGDAPVRDEFLLGEAAARAEVTEASLKILEGLVEGDEKKLVHPRLVEDYRTRVRATARLRDDEAGLSKVRKAHFEAALLAVAGGRFHLVRLHRDGKIHDSVLHTIESELDLEELRMRRFSGDDRGSH